MIDEPDMEPKGLDNEDEFAASLIADSNSKLSDQPTELIYPPLATGKPQLEKIPSPPQQPRWVGMKLGHFKLLRLIGEGKMGLVILAQDINLRRIVALKVLRKRIAGLNELEGVQQFLREARAAAQIEHPNVVRIYEINEHNGWWYIAMEMLEGESLQRVVKAGGPLHPTRACPLIADAATALSVAHEIGIIHRDVKPSNLMITRHGRCKLTDFGLVRLDDPNDPFDFNDRSVGTPHFIAPEMIRRQKQTPALDIYSLGCTLYYALTAQPPFTGEKLSDILTQHLEVPPPDVRNRCPEGPQSLALLLQHTMAKNPPDRPAAADLAAALRAEAISLFPDDSPGKPAPGSSVFTHSSTQASRTSTDAALTALERSTVVVRPAWFSRLAKSWRFWLPAGLAALVFVALFVWPIISQRITPIDYRAGRDIWALARLFPDAPKTYGLLPPYTTPPPLSLSRQVPPFSWLGKKDTTAVKFVAGKLGRHYYPIDDPDALLISSENFVGYKSAADAQADGKIPLPPVIFH